MFLLDVEPEEWKRHSPMFDMELFFWVLVFVPLYQGHKNGTFKTKHPTRYRDNKTIFDDLFQRYGGNCHTMRLEKEQFLSTTLGKGMYKMDNVDGCLMPYIELITDLGTQVLKHHDEALRRGVWSPREEEQAVDKYIEIVEGYEEKYRLDQAQEGMPHATG